MYFSNRARTHLHATLYVPTHLLIQDISKKINPTMKTKMMMMTTTTTTAATTMKIKKKNTANNELYACICGCACLNKDSLKQLNDS